MAAQALAAPRSSSAGAATHRSPTASTAPAEAISRSDGEGGMALYTPQLLEAGGRRPVVLDPQGMGEDVYAEEEKNPRSSFTLPALGLD